MAANDTLLNIGANAMAADGTPDATHTAQPDAAGSNQSTAARKAAGWAAAANVWEPGVYGWTIHTA